MNLVPLKLRLFPAEPDSLCHSILQAPIIPSHADYSGLQSFHHVREIWSTLHEWYGFNGDAPFTEEMGASIFHLLFPGELREFYHRNLDYCRKKQARLWLQVKCAAGHLAEIPWELAFDDDEKIFLAQYEQILFSRFEDEEESEPAITQEPRIVIFADQLADGQESADDRPYSIEPAIRSLEELFSRLKKRGLKLSYDILTNPDQSIFNKLLQQPATIFHFIGPCVENAGEECLLFLFQDKPILYSPARFAHQFSWFGRDQLFILEEKGASDDPRGLRIKRFAQKLSQAHLPMVLPLHNFTQQESIFNSFIIRLYQNLFAGNSVPEALQSAQIQAVEEKPDQFAALGHQCCYIQTLNPSLAIPQLTKIREAFHNLLPIKMGDTAEVYMPKVIKFLSSQMMHFLITELFEMFILGKGSENWLALSTIRPLCSATPTPPVLLWELGDSEILSLEILMTDQGAGETVVYSQQQDLGDRFDCSTAALTFESDRWYNWMILFNRNSKPYCRNGLFRLMSRSEVDEYHDKLHQLDQNQSLAEITRQFFRMGIDYEFQRFDKIIEEAQACTSQFEKKPEEIAFLELLRETYCRMEELFRKMKLGDEKDEVIKRIVGIEGKLNLLLGLTKKEETGNDWS